MDTVILFVTVFLVLWGFAECFRMLSKHTGPEATYIDRSGSMYYGPGELVPIEGKVYYFDTRVYDQQPSFCYGGTLYQCVIDHARRHGYNHIKIVTDGWGEMIDTSGLKVDWYYIDEDW